MTKDLKEKVYLALTGALTGLANGFFGGGGGMIVVPLMTFLLQVQAKKAHATALAVILPITLISAFIYFTSGKFNFAIGVPTGVGVVIGGVIGAWLLGKISAKWLTKVFAIVMLVAGVKSMVF
ncbi:MAG: sulfite exporter TauE/SafE family protein [Clostridia bacterium]|nr:sulfite exporter TauE/SafE family protein [Clostridia bacterium]